MWVWSVLTTQRKKLFLVYFTFYLFVPPSTGQWWLGSKWHQELAMPSNDDKGQSIAISVYLSTTTFCRQPLWIQYMTLGWSMLAQSPVCFCWALSESGFTTGDTIQRASLVEIFALYVKLMARGMQSLIGYDISLSEYFATTNVNTVGL